MSASRPTTRAVAEILSKERVVSLHSRCCAGVALIHRAVDHIKATLPLVQPQLMVGMLASVVVIDGAPFDVQDSMRRNAGDRGVDATGATGVSRAARVCICALVVPVREDREVVAEPRQANVSPGVIRCRELRIAVGRQIDRVERVVVQSVREWQRNGGDRIIPVIADVGFPWHATVLYRKYQIFADARCRCWGWAACSGIEATRHIRVLVAVRPDAVRLVEAMQE